MGYTREERGGGKMIKEILMAMIATAIMFLTVIIMVSLIIGVAMLVDFIQEKREKKREAVRAEKAKPNEALPAKNILKVEKTTLPIKEFVFQREIESKDIIEYKDEMFQFIKNNLKEEIGEEILNHFTDFECSRDFYTGRLVIKGRVRAVPKKETRKIESILSDTIHTFYG